MPLLTRSWLAVHSGRAGFGIALLSVVVSLFVQDRSLAGFVVTEYAVPVPVLLLTPLITAVGAVVMLEPTAADIEEAVPRPLFGPRLVWAVAALAAAAAPLILLTAVLAPSLVAANLRNVLVLTALALLGSLATGVSSAWALPALYCLTCLLFGEPSPGQGDAGLRGWAVLLDPRVDALSLTVGAAALLGAVVAYARWGRRLSLDVRQ